MAADGTALRPECILTYIFSLGEGGIPTDGKAVHIHNCQDGDEDPSFISVSMGTAAAI